MTGPQSPDDLVADMRSELTVAMKARDRSAVAALRAALAAVSNAEAVAVDDHGYDPALGVGTAEVARRVLSIDDVTAILRHEIDDLAETVATYREHGRDDEAGELERRMAVLEPFAG